jgi:hypothetical protein
VTGIFYPSTPNIVLTADNSIFGTFKQVACWRALLILGHYIHDPLGTSMLIKPIVEALIRQEYLHER